jgi:hypothetical protein
MDEDTRLFQDKPVLFDLDQEDDNMASDEATRELLEEIDRSLKGFEQAARTHAWLGDAGLNAESRLIGDAERACHLATEAAGVDLARFVCDAVLLDGGAVEGRVSDEVFQIQLPASWCLGLEDLPGYDPGVRVLSLTTRLEVTQDAMQIPSVFWDGHTHWYAEPSIACATFPLPLGATFFRIPV